MLREAGAMSTREMLLQAAILSATEMKTRGFLNQVVADGAAAEAALAADRQVSALANLTVRLNKQTLRAFNHAPALVQYARAATDPIANAFRYANSAEHREGIAAFMQKRKPMF